MAEKLETEKCYVVSSDLELGETYWNNRYNVNAIGWDLGEISPPLKAYIDQLTNKQLRILIPGCGNAYEVEYLLQQGFTNVTVIDISPTLVIKLKNKFDGNSSIKIVLGDFFTHAGEYDLILEQTFFCAINANLRKSYVAKMIELLSTDGKLAGVLFNKIFAQQGPPFGGSKSEYKLLFENWFELKVFDPCYNSFNKRIDSELFIIVNKK